jgi:hypothetical protein
MGRGITRVWVFWNCQYGFTAESEAVAYEVAHWAGHSPEVVVVALANRMVGSRS